MKKYITMLLRSWAASPLKFLLTIFTVACGAAILMLSFSVSSILNDEVTEALNAQGVILYAANGDWDEEGEIGLERPAQWDSQVLSYLESDIASLEAAAVAASVPFNEILTNESTYTLRSAIATDMDYFEVFSLELIAGDAMDQEDIDLGNKHIWISEETAILIYGSAEDAIGQYIRPPGETGMRGMNNRSQSIITTYTVTGVYESPSEISRRSYGIADLILPYTAVIPAGMNSSMIKDMLSRTLVLRSSDTDAEALQSSVRTVLTSVYGSDEELQLSIWEGSLSGESSYMEDLRNTVKIFSSAVNILGVVLLIVSAMGIFSIMVVESLSRRKEIALERALGASRISVLTEFFTWSIMLSLAGLVIGTIIAYFASPAVLSTITPLVGELSEDFNADASLRASAVAACASMVILIGGGLGILPAVPVVRENISETLREV